MVGRGESTHLNNCENYGTITQTGTVIEYSESCSYIGGLAGKCASVTNCKNTVNITANGAYVGGITGYINLPVNTNLYENTNTGEVTGTKYVGGVAGYLTNNSSGTYNIEKGINDGKFTGTMNVGGLVGYAYGIRTMTSCENSADITGGNYTNELYGYSSADIVFQ